MIIENTTFIIRFLIWDVQVVEIQEEVMIMQKSVFKKKICPYMEYT